MENRRWKQAYCVARRKTQGTLKKAKPNWQPWIVYFLKALQQQKRSLEAKIEHEHAVLSALPELSVQLVELARTRGRINLAEAIAATGANRNTIKDHLSALVRKQRLTQHGKARATWYGVYGIV